MMKRIQHIISSRYLYLLITFICYFIGSALLIGHHYDFYILSALLSLIMILSLKIAISHVKIVILTIILGILTLVSNWYIQFIELNQQILLIHFIIAISFLAIITSAVIVSVTKHESVRADTLLGAICGYLLVGFTWTFIYLTIVTLNPLAFDHHSISADYAHRVQDFIYFSFSTMTTTGYGDIIPTSNGARVFSWLEAVAGQIYLAVWISQLVGLHIVQKSKK